MKKLAERVQSSRRQERRAAGEQLVKNGAQRVNVGGRANLPDLAVRLLGRHVAGRAQDGAGAGLPDAGIQVLGQPKVGNLGKKG